MRLVERKRRLGATFGRGSTPRRRLVKGTLPVFFKPIGLDFIITEQGRVVLVELNHGFGRRGLMELFPQTSKLYRKTYWELRRIHGRCWTITERVRGVASNKVNTYKALGAHQPSTLVYRRYNAKVERWLDSLASDYILAKPAIGCGGEGILVLNRRDFRQAQGSVELGRANLLQEYVLSKQLKDEQQRSHVGCIRHIMMITSDGEQVSLRHLPSYWRVSPVPWVDRADKDALTANISRGASAMPVDQADFALLRHHGDEVCLDLIQHILELPQRPALGSSTVLQVGTG